MLELGLKGNRNICKGALLFSFRFDFCFLVFFFPKIKPLTIVASTSLLSVEGREDFCPFRRHLLIWPGRDPGGAPGCSPTSSETTEVVAVKDFTDDN